MFLARALVMDTHGFCEEVEVWDLMIHDIFILCNDYELGGP